MATKDNEKKFLAEILEKVKSGLLDSEMADNLIVFEIDRGVENLALFTDARESLGLKNEIAPIYIKEQTEKPGEDYQSRSQWDGGYQSQIDVELYLLYKKRRQIEEGTYQSPCTEI